MHVQLSEIGNMNKNSFFGNSAVLKYIVCEWRVDEMQTDGNFSQISRALC